MTHFNSSTLERNGITINTQSVSSSRSQDDYCDGWRIEPSGILEVKPSSSNGATCQSLVTMNVRIVKKGNVRFTYQYVYPSETESALLFTFHHKNSEEVAVSKPSYSGLSEIDTFDIKFPRQTGYTSSRWSSLDVPLQPGFYSFIWRSLVLGSGFSRDVFGSFSTNGKKVRRSVSSTPSSQGFIRIKSIDIYGTAFASDCTPCDEGFYSNTTGSGNCLPCPASTFSAQKGSVTCSQCDSTTSYSSPGSTACIRRPICDMNDVYQVKSSCVQNQQMTIYKWIEPKICHDVSNLLSRLGPSKIPCNSSSLQSDRECSPGMELINGKCSFCPPNHYNDGSLVKCKQCPPSSLPRYELVLNTWKNELDSSVSQFLTSDCFSTQDPSVVFNDCNVNLDPWKVIPSTEGSYIRSSETPLDSILTLTLTIPGFRHSSGGQFMFAFSLIGPDSSLQLYEVKGKMSRLIGFWTTATGGTSPGEREGLDQTGTTSVKVKEDERVEFRHFVRENVPVSFTWIYRRSQLVQSHAKIYSISLSNPSASGAVSCSSCSMNEISNLVASEDVDLKGKIGLKNRHGEISKDVDEEYKCIPCPSGQYLNVEGGKDESRNLVTFSTTSSSPSLTSSRLEQGRVVVNGSDDSFMMVEGTRRRRNSRETGNRGGGKLVELNAECLKCPPGFIINSTLPFAKGMRESCIKCGPGLISNSEGTECIADCNTLEIDGDEYSLSSLSYPLSFQASQLFTASGMKYFHTFNISLCGSPIKDLCANNASSPKFSTSIDPGGFVDSSLSSLVCRSTMIPDGDENVFSTQSVSLASKLRGVSRKPKLLEQEVIGQFASVKSDLHFFFEPTSPTTSCKKGRSVIITLRCDPSVPSDSTPIISAPSSCPLATCDGCTFNLLIRSNSSATCRKCRETDYDTVRGECVDGVQNVHLINPKNCIIDMVSRKNILVRHCSLLPRSIQLFLTFISFFAVIMTVLLIYFWKKNRKLEYNYSQLIENKNTSESCMEDDDEEEDNKDEATRTRRHDSSEHPSLRQKIISNRNEVDYAGYETIQLTKHMQEDVC